jgi:hypothetical protein
MAEVWETDADAVVPLAGPDPTTRVQADARAGRDPGDRDRFPPTSEARTGADPEAARREYLARVPGDWNFEQGLGMHATDSVDYGVVLSGEIWLELDDGAEVRLGPGDVVVQNGTRHAWHTRAVEPCVVFFVLVGARRAGGEPTPAGDQGR